LAANLFGIGLASFFLVALEHNGGDAARHFLLPGFCGGLTTFSAVAFQTLEPSTGGIVYLLETVLLSLVVVAISIPLARKVLRVYL